jgi:hypothetical protein
MAVTPLLLLGVASRWTGEITLALFAGEQIVIEGAAPAAAHVPLTATVAIAVVFPPGPAAVRV